MTITVEDISSGAIVRISGEVDLSVSPEIKEKILEQIELNKKVMVRRVSLKGKIAIQK